MFTVKLTKEDWVQVIHTLAWVNAESDMVPDEARIRSSRVKQTKLTDQEVWNV